uniref:Uncharacterized protein n=1 Tax=Trypanosoma vivax (strain Y486) TaxID=1055687 RepID=G0TR91_TRYVY|nr:hypothetical protein, unlikely [Trypanosoma vivax Y486]
MQADPSFQTTSAHQPHSQHFNNRWCPSPTSYNHLPYDTLLPTPRSARFGLTLQSCRFLRSPLLLLFIPCGSSPNTPTLTASKATRRENRLPNEQAQTRINKEEKHLKGREIWRRVYSCRH